MGGWLYQKEQEAKSIKELPDVKFAAFGQGIKAPHFAIYVKKLLEEKYGEQRVLQGGLQVTTSLDLDIQEQAQKLSLIKSTRPKIKIASWKWSCSCSKLENRGNFGLGWF